MTHQVPEGISPGQKQTSEKESEERKAFQRFPLPPLVQTLFLILKSYGHCCICLSLPYDDPFFFSVAYLYLLDLSTGSENNWFMAVAESLKVRRSYTQERSEIISKNTLTFCDSML